MLRTYCFNNQRQWDEHLPFVMFARNTTVHASTQQSPYKILFGLDETTVEDWGRGTVETRPIATEFVQEVEAIRSTVQEQIRRSHETNDKQRNKAIRRTIFNVGDMVMCRIEPAAHGLNARFDGPYKVSRLLSPYVVEIERNEQRKTVNVRKLKLMHQ